VELFIAGLHNPVRTDVDLQYPSNLEVAMSLTFTYERRGHEDEEDFPTQVAKPSGSKLLKSTVTTVPAIAKGTSTTGNQVPGAVMEGSLTLLESRLNVSHQPRWRIAE
jgi:hypothetical protein